MLSVMGSLREVVFNYFGDDQAQSCSAGFVLLFLCFEEISLLISKSFQGEKAEIKRHHHIFLELKKALNIPVQNLLLPSIRSHREKFLGSERPHLHVIKLAIPQIPILCCFYYCSIINLTDKNALGMERLKALVKTGIIISLALPIFFALTFDKWHWLRSPRACNEDI